MTSLIKNNERLDDLQLNNLYIIQNPNEYLFTSDAVALANFVHISNYGKMVDLCSGSGIIGILANAKNKIEEVKLIEIQSTLADMSQRSLEYNGIKNIEVICDKLQGIHSKIGSGIYDVVTCNPPYKAVGSTKLLSEKASIAMCKHEITVTLEEIILEASKLLKFGGYFYTVNKEERLVDIITLCKKYGLEPKELKILPSNKGSNIILVKAKRGGKSGIKIAIG